MNREEAQFILRAYRADGADASDPQFEEALALVRQDPELARWFAEEQTLDAVLNSKLRAVPVSHDLKSQLLAARKTVRPVQWWRKPVWLAAAAAVVLLLSMTAVILLRHGANPVDFAEFRRAMVASSLDMRQHIDVMGLDTDEIKKWLANNRGEADFVLPPRLMEKRAMGCKVLKWQGRRVTLLCFKFSGKHLDAFVVNEADLPGVALGSGPQFSSDANATTVGWRHQGKIYLLAGDLSQSELEQLL